VLVAWLDHSCHSGPRRAHTASPMAIADRQVRGCWVLYPGAIQPNSLELGVRLAQTRLVVPTLIGIPQRPHPGCSWVRGVVNAWGAGWLFIAPRYSTSGVERGRGNEEKWWAEQPTHTQSQKQTVQTHAQKTAKVSFNATAIK
jgi:hypothetical protein